MRSVVQGIRRTLGVAPSQKAPLLADQLKSVLKELPTGLIGLRDRALLLIGFGGAFRRSELVGLDVGDVVFGERGLEVLIRRSKTDQEGAGRKIGIPSARKTEHCPVVALKGWLDAGAISSGPIFREINRHARVGGGRLSDRGVALIVKRSVERAGLEPKDFAGHSLRAGLVTSAAIEGKSMTAIMKQTGHRSVAMVTRYVRDATLFNDNAAEGLL